MTSPHLAPVPETAVRDIKMFYGVKRVAVVAGVTMSGMWVEIASKSAERHGLIHRDVLPEPFDAPDHVGNFTEGGIYSAFFFSVLEGILSRRSRGNPEVDPETVTKRAALGALGLSAILQFAGEKFVGVSAGNHTDMIDAVYGTAYSALGLHLAAKGYNAARRSTIRQIDDLFESERAAAAEEAKALAEEKALKRRERSSERLAVRNPDPAIRAKRQRQRTNRKKKRHSK